MFGRTREENVKYGEVFSDANLEFVTVKYANDLIVSYSTDDKKAYEILIVGKDAAKIFKYAENSHTADGLVKTLKAKGYDCYSNDIAFILNLRSSFDSLLYGVTVEFDDRCSENCCCGNVYRDNLSLLGLPKIGRPILLCVKCYSALLFRKSKFLKFATY